jgi:hypothetical protein
MRFFTIRKADIDGDLRRTFEQYGVGSMQAILGGIKYFTFNGEETQVEKYREPLLAWLTEEYDKADRKQSWSTTMEAAITLLVGAEVVIELLRLSGLVSR